MRISIQLASMETTPARPFISVAELGRRLGVSKRTAYNLVRDGEVPVIELRCVSG